MGNISPKFDDAGNIKPSKKASAEKIDPVVALIMAVGGAMNAGDSRSIYETGQVGV